MLLFALFCGSLWLMFGYAGCLLVLVLVVWFFCGITCWLVDFFVCLRVVGLCISG